MTTNTNAAVTIQTCAHSAPSPPVWFGELTMLAQCLHQQGVLAAICKHVRFARRRFERYEVIDFIAVLFGYAESLERTLETFYERLHPFAAAFMALFGRDRLPSRSALSRWLAALDQAAVDSVRSLFLSDLLARRLTEEEPRGGLWDRMGSQWLVFDVDGTREAARQRALPQTGLRLRAGYVRFVPQATGDASAGRSCARAPPFCRRIPISGLAPSAT